MTPNSNKTIYAMILSFIWGLGHSYLGHMGRGFSIFLLCLTTIIIINLFTFEFSYPKLFLLIPLIFYWIFTIYDLKRLYKTNLNNNNLENAKSSDSIIYKNCLGNLNNNNLENAKSSDSIICKNCLSENSNYSKYCNKCYFNLHAITNRKKEIKLFLFGIVSIFLFAHFIIEPVIINGGFTGIVPYQFNNIKMVYPSNWDVLNNDSISDSLVTISAPKDTASHTSPAILSITIDNLLINFPIKNNSLSSVEDDDFVFIKIDFNMSLDEFTQIRIDSIKKYHPDLQLKQISLANKDAYEATYSINSNDEIEKVIQIWTIYDNKIYIITAIIEESEYNIYYPTIKRILYSLQF